LRRVPRIGVALRQVMRVAPAECDDALPAAEALLPERQRFRVGALPRSVPDLDGVEARRVGILPGRAERLWMVHADEGSARRGFAHLALDGAGFGLAEFPPPIGPPSVPVAAVRRDFGARHDDWHAVAAGSVRELMPDAVVIGDAEELQACLCGGGEHLLWRRVPVRIQRVAVQITTKPAGACRGLEGQGGSRRSGGRRP
jgi:hypothetical protein